MLASLWNKDHTLKLFIHASYYIIAATVLLWGSSLLQILINYSKDLGRMLRTHRLSLIAVSVISLVLWSSVSQDYKVLSDETNLLSIAESLYSDKTALNTTMGKWYFDNFWPVNEEIPKRPLLYPFLVSLIHSLFGYDISHGFYLNGALLILLNLMVFLSISHLGGSILGWTGVALLNTNPILHITAASGGYDLLALFLFALVCLLFALCVKYPTPLHLSSLWTSLIALSHVRYESVIFLAIFPTALLITQRINRQSVMALGNFLAITPILLLPRLWQIILKPNDFENPQGVDLLSLDHLAKHSAILLDSLFDFGLKLPFASIFLSLGLISLALAIISLLSKHKHKIDDHLRLCFWTFLLAMLSATLIYLAHHFGVFYHPTQARFFLLFSSFVVLMPLVLIGYKIFSGAWLLTIAIFGAFYYHPVASEARFVNQLSLIRETRAIRDFLSKIPHKNYLLITERPGQYAVERIGAVNFEWAQKNQKAIMNDYNRYLYRDIYAIREVYYQRFGEKQDEPVKKLPNSFDTEVLFRLQNKADRYIEFLHIKRQTG